MIFIIFGSVLGSIALLLIIVLLYRVLRQRQNARALVLHTPNRIEEGQFVQIGSLEQWIQIRGENRDNPILLILHGGPGIAFSAFTPIFRKWEQYFTIVQWDQPGAGKTASRHGKAGYHALTIESMAQDGIQVAEWVLLHLNQRKLILFAASWGSILGLLMLKRRPDLFRAYVGTGQFVNETISQPLAYALALDQARRLGDDKTLEALESMGPPPYADRKTFHMERQTIGKVAPESTQEPRFPTLGKMLSAAFFSPGYSLKDGFAFIKGVPSSIARLEESMLAFDARQIGTMFETPLFFFQGTIDVYTPAQSVQEYIATLQASHKELLLWENEGHLTFLIRPEKVLKELIARVRPLVMKDEAHNP